jgi:hypothetical protein
MLSSPVRVKYQSLVWGNLQVESASTPRRWAASGDSAKFCCLAVENIKNRGKDGFALLSRGDLVVDGEPHIHRLLIFIRLAVGGGCGRLANNTGQHDHRDQVGSHQQELGGDGNLQDCQLGL